METITSKPRPLAFGVVAPDDSGLLHPLDAPQARGRGESDPAAQIGVAQSDVPARSGNDYAFDVPASAVPVLVALAVTVGLQLWRRNATLSIFAGTAVSVLLASGIAALS
jgi:hypothetical protein